MLLHNGYDTVIQIKIFEALKKKTNESADNLKIWDIICQQNIYRQTYKIAARPTGWDGSVGHFDGYDASYWLRYCNSFQFVWNCEVKLMYSVFMWIYVGYYMSNKCIQTDI